MSESDQEFTIELADSEPTPKTLRNALGRFATGVTVITTRTTSGAVLGVTANSFSSVSLDPPLVLWSLRAEAPSMPGFTESGCFAINVLGADQQHHSRQFATSASDKFDGVDWLPGLGAARFCPTASLDSNVGRSRRSLPVTIRCLSVASFARHTITASPFCFMAVPTARSFPWLRQARL